MTSTIVLHGRDMEDSYYSYSTRGDLIQSWIDGGFGPLSAELVAHLREVEPQCEYWGMNGDSKDALADPEAFNVMFYSSINKEDRMSGDALLHHLSSYLPSLEDLTKAFELSRESSGAPEVVEFQIW